MDGSFIQQSPEPRAEDAIFDVDLEKIILESRLEQRDRVIKLLEGEMCQSMLNRLSGHKDMKARTRLFSQETFWDRFKMAALVASAKESLNQLAQMNATVALFGEKRTGKSSLGNHLLGTPAFPVGTECTTSVPFFISSAPTGSLSQFLRDPSSVQLSYRFNPDVKTDVSLDSQMKYFLSCLQESPKELEEVKSMHPAYAKLLQHFWNNTNNAQPVQFPKDLISDTTMFQRLLTPPANVVRGNPLVMSFHLHAPIFDIDRTGVTLVDCPGLSEDILLSKLTAETIASASVIVFVYDNETSLSDKKAANVDMLLNQIGLGKQVICVFNTLKMKQKNMTQEEQDQRYKKISNELKSLISSKLATHSSSKTPLPKFIRAYVPDPKDTEPSGDIMNVRAHILRAISEVMMNNITSALQAYHNLVSGVLLFSSRFAENIMHSALLKYSLPDPTHLKREKRYRELEAEARLLNQSIEKLLADAQARIRNIYMDFDKKVLLKVTAQKSEILGQDGQDTVVFAQYIANDRESQKRFAEELRAKLLHKVQSALQRDAEAFRASTCVGFANWLSDEVEKIEQQIQVLQQRNLRMISESDANLCITVHQDLSTLPQPKLDYRWMLGSGAVVSVAGATAVVGLFMANLVVSAAIVAAFAAPLSIAGIGLGLAAFALTMGTEENLNRAAFHHSIRQNFCTEIGNWYRSPEARTAYRKTALGDLEKIVDQICAALKLRVHQAEGFATSTTCTASAEDLIQTVWIRDTAARFERDISREVHMLTGSKTWKAVAHSPDGPSCRVCGTDIQRCGHMCHICEIVCGHQCPYCKGHQEAMLASGTANDLQGYNPLVEKSKETVDIIPDMLNILSEAPGRCNPEPPPQKEDPPQGNLAMSQRPPSDTKTQLERLLDSPVSVLGSHVANRFSPDLISFAASVSQVDWANKAGADHSQLARCVNLFVRSIHGALQSKLESDRLLRAPPGSHGSGDVRLSYSQTKKLLRACYHAVFEAEISPGQLPKKTLGQFIFSKYNEFFATRNQKFMAWAKTEKDHKDFKRLEKVFGKGHDAWDDVVKKFTNILDNAKNPWDIYKAFKKLEHYVMDFARARAEADSAIMAKLVESPLGADDLWPAWELCVLLSTHKNMVPSLNMATHFLAEYPVFLLDNYEPQLNFVYGICHKVVRGKNLYCSFPCPASDLLCPE